MPETKFSAQRRQTFFVKAHGSRRNFSDITFNSVLLCYCILHSVPNEKGSLRDRRKSQTGSRGQYTLFLFYKNVVFPAQAEYSYFSADFKLKIFLYYS